MEQAKQGMLSLEEAWCYIQGIDFSHVINKLILESGWSKKHANIICGMYRNFLFLKKKYGDQCKLPPSHDIDDFWHAHILDTQKYRVDCECIFGHYLDHYPYFGIDEHSSVAELVAEFELMQKIYAAEFNNACIYEVRNIYSKMASFIKRIVRVKQPKKLLLMWKNLAARASHFRAYLAS